MIVIFSGTTEGRKLSEFLCDKRISHHVCVATESGEVVMEKNDYADIHIGRMNEEEMMEFLRGDKYSLVVDATHLYAVDVTKNIQTVCNELDKEYIRVIRDEELTVENSAYYYEDATSCALDLEKTKGNILLTTGSKELGIYTEHKRLLSRLYVRVLPSSEAMDLCQKSGIDERHIIAMYGPHSIEMNEAVIRQYDIEHIVTKQSGKIGGYDEKIIAARNTGCKVHIVSKPESVEGMSLSQCEDLLVQRLGIEKAASKKISVSLVGIGMGNDDTLTIAGKRVIDECDMIFGAKRMLDSYRGQATQFPVYLAEDIKSIIEEKKDTYPKEKLNVVVLFSGDTGIYSGADKLYQNMSGWEMITEIKIIPGISSFSAFAARLGRNYTDAALLSLHGKSNDDEARQRIASAIKNKNQVYVLMSGKDDFSILHRLIGEAGVGETTVDIGYELSYEQEQIIHTDSDNMVNVINGLDDGLFIVRVERPIG